MGETEIKEAKRIAAGIASLAQSYAGLAEAERGVAHYQTSPLIEAVARLAKLIAPLR